MANKLEPKLHMRAIEYAVKRANGTHGTFVIPVFDNKDVEAIKVEVGVNIHSREIKRGEESNAE